MPHEIERVLAAAAGTVWAIDPAKGLEIANLLALRAGGEPRAWTDDEAGEPKAQIAQAVDGRRGPVHILRLHGVVFPRASMMSDISGGQSLEQFGRAFDEAAADERAAAIVIDVDSPGGSTALVEETAAKVFGARRADRPIVAVADTMAASAAYWIASAADQIAAAPSAGVGSIGVYTLHDDMSAMMETLGVDRTVIKSGPRKIENNPWGPLEDSAKAALQDNVAETYRAFTSDVARFRGVSASVVRADPESEDRHYGGGRYYGARQARQYGMIDRIATLETVVADLADGKRLRRPGSRRAEIRRRRLALGG